MNSVHSMFFQWSSEDRCCVIFPPDFANQVMQPCTEGATYEEAAKHGQEVIETLIDLFQSEGRPLPEPKVFPTQSLQVA